MSSEERARESQSLMFGLAAAGGRRLSRRVAEARALRPAEQLPSEDGRS
jgi:hypothetical protein